MPTFVNLNAIEQTRPRGQCRVDGVELPRHRTDAATEAHRVDGVGRPKFDFHTGQEEDAPQGGVDVAGAVREDARS